MRRLSLKRPLIVVFFLVTLLLIPSSVVQKFRGRVMSLMSPMWRHGGESCDLESMQRLEAENHLLRLELIHLQEANEELKYHETKTDVVTARVIYRDPGQWMSLCWVDVGEKTNRVLGKKIIQHNAPVLVGKALVGIVEEVYENQSSIRLITDPLLKPSVRVVRGHLQDVVFAEHLKSVTSRLEKNAPINVISYLKQIEEQLEGPATNWLLAKGIIQGSKVPLWRGRGQMLCGVGFNCDFPDDKAVARELKNGKVINDPYAEAMPILLENDLLITTGLDGIFPMGLSVAEVTKVYPLREGAYTYEIEATPVVKNLEALQTVCIIPKMEFKLP